MLTAEGGYFKFCFMIEIWKPVFGYEDYYQVSNTGKIRSLDRIVLSRGSRMCKGKIIKQGTDKYGYKTIHLRKNGNRKSFFVHRLVLINFIGIDENKSQVNHKNSNKQDNVLSNLEWMTPIENTRHAWRNIRNGISCKAKK